MRDFKNCFWGGSSFSWSSGRVWQRSAHRSSDRPLRAT